MGTKIDGPITSEAIDSSGEILDLKGHDITDFLEGKAFANFEHENKSPEGIVGRFIFAKKIFKESDCDNDRQREFWKQLKLPFLYGICELFDGEDHPGATAIAAMLRYFKNRKEKIQIGFSIEGSTLKRDGNLLERSVGRRAAITLRPCNRTCWIDMIGEDEAKKTLDKSEYGIGHSTHVVEVESAILDEATSSNPKKDLYDIKKALVDLNKTLTASGGNIAPGQLVGGAALVREEIANHSVKNRLKAALRDWNRTRPLKEAIKAALPEVAESYIDHFTQLAEEMSLRKNAKLIRVSAKHAQPNSSEEQKELIEGLYYDPAKEFTPEHESYNSTGKTLLKLKNDKGQDVFVKQFGSGSDADDMGLRDDRHAASAAYSDIARNVFGLEEHVPVTTAFSHPQINEGRPAQAMQFLKGETSLEGAAHWERGLKQHKKDGHIQKLLIADHILGESDRHDGNMIIQPDGKVAHIDNDHAFSYSGAAPHNFQDISEEDEGFHSDKLHPMTQKWLASIDAKLLATQMIKHGLDEEKIRKALVALKSYQKYATKPITHHALWTLIQSTMQGTSPKKEEAS